MPVYLVYGQEGLSSRLPVPAKAPRDGPLNQLPTFISLLAIVAALLLCANNSFINLTHLASLLQLRRCRIENRVRSLGLSDGICILKMFLFRRAVQYVCTINNLRQSLRFK
jgi:hypothetical protein